MASAPTRRTSPVLIVSAVAGIVFLYVFLVPRSRLAAALGYHSDGEDAFEHPITTLMADAQAKHAKMLGRQSRTLSQAVATYRNRYGRDPPKGFDDWWNFAQKNKVKIIDEYDSMNKDLAPFWSLSPQELRRRARQVSTESFAVLRIV